ncbi:UDP-2,4-diacetamido-2,4, 6-trideoxy-beta-L-altropyranose hydrolase [Shewanella loihica]|nr:hypothetical protein K0H80_06615 [Shewanella aegiceratis]QYJ95061.1 hypothetical protein K0I31_06670 [Shewanella spartinae]
MRLYALAEAAANQFDIWFVYKTCSDALLSKLKRANFNLLQISSSLTGSELKQHKFDTIIVDDYELTGNEWHQLVSTGSYLVKLDDALDDDPILADLIINPAPNCTQTDYQSRAPHANYCLGPHFTYLRREFTTCHFTPLMARPNLLISLGGTDTKSLALPLSKALLKTLNQCQVQLLLGKPHQDQIALEALTREQVNFSLICDPQSVAEVMTLSGLAISAAGGTLGELASQGVPTLALVTVDNQLPALTSPLNNTWYQAIDCRHYEQSEPESESNLALINEIATQAYALWHNKCCRQLMSDKARQLIDGQGCQRVIDRLVIGLEEKSKHQ